LYVSTPSVPQSWGISKKSIWGTSPDPWQEVLHLFVPDPQVPGRDESLLPLFVIPAQAGIPPQGEH